MSPPHLPKWKMALIVGAPALTALIAATIVIGRCIIYRIRRMGTVVDEVAGRQAVVQSVSGDQQRSAGSSFPPPPWSSSPTVHTPASSDSSVAAEDGPAELGFGVRNPLQRVAQRVTSAKGSREFHYEELVKATGNFDWRLKLGQGSAGAVFRGVLLGDEGIEILVAIKRFHATVSEDMSRHVRRDLRGHPLRHRNLAYLQGYCLRKGKLHLVYPYMANGSLERHLFVEEGKSSRLPWACRCNIIVGVATGLHYLHSQRSVHGSVKVSNVLLDPDFTVRLGDFGYSRLGPLKNRATAGTPYLAPECINSGTLNTNPTYEQDVFYFGAMVLEVVCGRRRSAYVVTGDFKLFLEILDAVDATLMAGGEVDQAVAMRLLLVGLGCSHPDPKQRPKMEDVVKHMQSDDGVPPITVPLFKPRYDHAPA